jgi:hypothetical protein
MLSIVDVAPPRSLTAGRMQTTKRRILRYAHQHGELPNRLSELPRFDGYSNEIVDAWKRPIAFEKSATGRVTLCSLGRDGKIGGEGDDADIVRSFPARDEQNRWSDEMVNWIEDSFVQRKL